MSDSTGITAETLGSALLANFPGVRFQRHTIPFVDTVSGARNVVGDIERAAGAGADPIVFATVKSAEILDELTRSQAVVIDLLGGHLRELEAALGSTASEQLGQYHGVGDIEQYFARMRAVEYAIEHDDGQSLRALDIADVIIIAPSRCGKTPTTMYLALQYGLLVANYPLTDDDFPSDGLPATVREVRGPLLRADHDAAAAEPGAARAPPELDATRASRSAPSSCAAPKTSTAATACRSSTPRRSRSRRCRP